MKNIDKKYFKLEADTGIKYESFAKVKISLKNLNSVSRNQLEFLRKGGFFILPCVLALVRFSFYFDTAINILISALRLSPQVL